jgi:hypothetical protein
MFPRHSIIASAGSPQPVFALEQDLVIEAQEIAEKMISGSPKTDNFEVHAP